MKSNRISILIKRTSLLIDKAANQFLTPYDLSNSQRKIMMLLYQNPDQSIRQADIESQFSLTNPTVTGIIKNLEKKGLVKRIQNPNDKRSNVLGLTKQALEIRDELDNLGEKLEAQITQNLTKAESRQLCELLQKMLQKSSSN